ncbi:MAG: polyamine ABC transporter substrate-binding protein [Gaiellales bacterium]
MTRAISRRELLRRAALAGGTLAGGGLLAACSGGGGTSKASTSTPSATTSTNGADRVAASWTVSNWPNYIDTVNGRHPSIIEFDKLNTTTTTYLEDISSNETFFQTVRAKLEAGQDIGRDLVVLSDWMADRWIQLGYVLPLDHSKLPAVDRALMPALRNRPIDPKDQYLVPWQSGVTGLVYDRRRSGGAKLTSVNAVFDPRFKGRVAMLNSMRDTLGMVLIGMGKDPSKATVNDAAAAVEKLRPYVRSGHIKAFTGSDYTTRLSTGDVVVAFGYSSDYVRFAPADKHVKFQIPDEGCMLWSDNMLIPRHAPHSFNAHLWMNWYYEPRTAAMVAEAVQYMTPVQGARNAEKKVHPQATGLLQNKLVFPPTAQLAKARVFNSLTPTEEGQMQTLFNGLLQL